MSRGHFDYLVDNSAYGQYNLDTNELAARGLARSRYDRKGNVIFYDSFIEGADHWLLLPAGNGYIRPTINYPYETGAVMEMQANTVPASDIIMYKRLPFIEAGIYGFEFLFSLDGTADAGNDIIEVDVLYDNNEVNLNARLRIYADDGYITINHGAAYPGTQKTILTGIDQIRYTNYLRHYHYFKLTLNMITGRYGRLIFNNLGVDLSQYLMYEETAYTQNIIQLALYNKYQVSAAVLRIANVVITTNEPL